MDKATLRRMVDAELALSLSEARTTLAGLEGDDTASGARKREKAEAEANAFSGEISRRDRLQRELRKVPRADGNGGPSISVGAEEVTYRPDGGPSFFGDLIRSRRGDPDSFDRLLRHQREMRQNPLTTTAGDGGDFVPPMYLGELAAEDAKSGRPFADAIGARPLPETGMTATIPKVTVGSSIAKQANEGDAVQDGSMDTDKISAAVFTVAGQQDLSQQLFDRADPGMDRIIASDLAGEYAQQLNSEILNSASAPLGILNDTAANTVSYTDASPTLAELYPVLAEAISAIHENRKLSPQAVFMAPRRWAWITSALDTTQRPVVPPEAGVNAAARFDRVAAENVVGEIMGLPVIVDHSLPTTDGAGTNEDVILVSRVSDLVLLEAQPRVRVLSEILSDTLQVRIQLFSYAVFSSERYSKGSTIISGTGLVNPF